jgi:cell wall-associated NlpC family hydrolase
LEGALQLKKIVTMTCGLVLALGIGTGSAFAATPLEDATDKLLGVKYTYGGDSVKEGFDCSGFTSFVFNQFGIKLSRSSDDQTQDGTKIKKADLRPGDLVFFDTDSRVNNGTISHVGIYLGDDEFVHAASGTKNKKGQVMKNKLSEKYYANSYVTAARVLSEEEFKKIATELEAAVQESAAQESAAQEKPKEEVKQGS